PEIIEQNIDSIVEHWLAEVKKDEEISAIPLSKADRQDHVPHLLKQALARAHGRQITPADTDAAQLHGEARRKQVATTRWSLLGCEKVRARLSIRPARSMRKRMRNNHFDPPTGMHLARRTQRTVSNTS